jgi:uncharacterized protein (AIM24 family)
MFNLQTVNELACVAEGHDVMYCKKGTMVAYQGQFKFEKLLIGPGGNLASALISHVARRFTGENMEIMKVTGQGACYFADAAKHVTVIHLNPGDSIGVESENLLAFSAACDYGVKMIGVGVLSQKGLFTSKISAHSPGAQVAVLSDGNPIVIQSPCVVDPDAVVCWTGADPSFKLDVNWKTIIGQTSGESYMLEFKQPGQTVIIQPAERQSGLKLGMDDGEEAQTQSHAFQNSQHNMQNSFSSAQQMFGNNMGGAGNILGSILGGR